MDGAYPYRVKFKDIRVKPPEAEASRARAQKTRVCEQQGCDLAGDHPAPKRGSNGRHWFCQRHAGEYNRRFNFFEGMTEEEVIAFNNRARHGFKDTWKFGTGPMAGEKAAQAHDPRKWRGREIFEDGVEGAERRAAERERSSLQRRALKELDLDENSTSTEIRARYADYVRRFHPDSNGGDRSSEHKLARVLRAGKVLKAAGLMRA